MSLVDVVTVSYNSAAELRRCVAPLSGFRGTTVYVVDNASADNGLQTIADLDVVTVPLSTNGGFAHGCNVGWRQGDAPYVLFINPDAEIDERSLAYLVDVLETTEKVGAIAPNILNEDGSLAFSLRRLPQLRTTYAQALFLHRAFPRATWADELIRDDRSYRTPCAPEWVSGACILVRRAVLEELDGWDEQFFLFGEDMDLCRRIREADWDLRFEPAATCRHIGGASAPKAAMLPILTHSRILYARKHHGRFYALLERGGIALSAITHTVAGRGARRGYARALLVSTAIRRPRS